MVYTRIKGLSAGLSAVGCPLDSTSVVVLGAVRVALRAARRATQCASSMLTRVPGALRGSACGVGASELQCSTHGPVPHFTALLVHKAKWVLLRLRVGGIPFEIFDRP